MEKLVDKPCECGNREVETIYRDGKEVSMTCTNCGKEQIEIKIKRL